MGIVPEKLHTVLDLSKARRVYAVGDIHGEYAMLREKLVALDFDPTKDHLISVGDLADRGPESLEAFDYIKQPWFHRVLGNHEHIPNDYLTGQATYYQLEGWGAKWFLDLPKDDQYRFSAILLDAPYMLTVLTPGGRKIGFVHADVMSDWDRHVKSLNQLWARDFSIESRETIKTLMKAKRDKTPVNQAELRVKNIDHVFQGHSVLGAPLTLANRSWIDTGACMGGDMTVVEIDSFVRFHHGNQAQPPT